MRITFGKHKLSKEELIAKIHEIFTSYIEISSRQNRENFHLLKQQETELIGKLNQILNKTNRWYHKLFKIISKLTFGFISFKENPAKQLTEEDINTIACTWLNSDLNTNYLANYFLQTLIQKGHKTKLVENLTYVLTFLHATKIYTSLTLEKKQEVLNYIRNPANQQHLNTIREIVERNVIGNELPLVITIPEDMLPKLYKMFPNEQKLSTGRIIQILELPFSQEELTTRRRRKPKKEIPKTLVTQEEATKLHELLPHI